MRFNLRWLLKYVDLDLPLEQILDGLTMAGLEVEECIDVGYDSGRVVVAEILEILPHGGGARNLSLCRVRASADPDAKPLQIICGAPAMQVGDHVPLALPGAVLAGGRKIRKTRIKGETSEGMLCSGPELAWNEDASCLLLLDDSLPVGEPLDALIDVAVTPNRPDCLAVTGVARDIGAYFRKPFHGPPVRCQETTEPTESFARVEIEDKEGCPRYTARVVRNVQVGPSPPWLARAVEAAGLRPINNIVDVTNFVLMELGHPLHAFDLDTISEHSIIVRRAREGETLRTLDGFDRQLTSQDLLITDPSRAIALAGIMGGENTEITDATVHVLIESAYFDPIRIRRTRTRLEVQTDSSFRFERGMDRENVHVALNRAAQLMREVAGGEVTRGVIDVQGPRVKPRVLTLRAQRCNAILGTELESSEMADLMACIGCEITRSDRDQMIVAPPSHRVDLLREIDLIEEIGRLYGYDKIPSTVPYVPARPADKQPAQVLCERMAALLADEGLSEVVTYSMTDREAIERSRQSVDGLVELVNPLTRAQSVLRTSLIPSVLDTMVYNHKRGSTDLAICEVGATYHWKGGSSDPYEERDHAVAALSGRRPPHWSRPDSPWDFFDVKGMVERVLEGLGVVPDRIESARRPELHPGRSATFFKGEKALCSFGQLHPDVGDAWELRGDAFLAVFDLEPLLEHVDLGRRYSDVPQYPSVVRDLALVVGADVPAGAIDATLRDAGGAILESLLLFDIYEGEPVPKGKRSLAYSLTFRAPDRTLTDDEVNAIQKRLLAAVAEKHGAELRSA